MATARTAKGSHTRNKTQNRDNDTKSHGRGDLHAGFLDYAQDFGRGLNTAERLRFGRVE